MATETAQAIGKVVIVYGTVKAVSPAGVERVLTPNSLVYANERIITGSDGSVSLIFTEKNIHLDLGRMTEMVLDQDVYADTEGRYEVAEGMPDVADIQAALASGNFDPTLVLPSPAAGGGVIATGPRGGGRQLVIFTPDQMEVIPDSGAETTGISRNFLDPPPVEYVPEDEPVGILGPIAGAPAPVFFTPDTPDAPPPEPPVIPPPPLDTAPSIGEAEVILREANLPDGSSPDLYGLIKGGSLADLKVDFGPDTSGSLDFGGGYVILIDGIGGDSITIPGKYGTLVVNDDGTWTYTLTDNTLDHLNRGAVEANDIVQESFPFSAIDSDGSVTPGGNITAIILDDGPAVSVSAKPLREREGIIAEVREDGMSLTSDGTNPVDRSEGNRGSGQSMSSDEASGGTEPETSLASLFSSTAIVGADQPGTTTDTRIFLSADTSNMSTLYSRGEVLNYEVSPDGTTLTASTSHGTVFVLTVNEGGSWAFDLQDQLDHQAALGVTTNLITQADGSKWVAGIDFSSMLRATVTVTDADNDSVTATSTTGAAANSFMIKVVDDVPVVTVSAVPLAESKGIVVEVQEDGMSLISDGTNPVDRSEGNRVDADAKNSDEVSSGTDPKMLLTSLFSLSEDDGGVGADEPGTSDIKVFLSPDTSALSTLYSRGEVLNYKVSQDGTTLTASTSYGTVFVLTVNEGGSWAFDLQDQLDHQAVPGVTTNLISQADGSKWVAGIDFSSLLRARVTVTDADGDTVSATSTTGADPNSFMVKVVDDVPTAHDGQDSYLANQTGNSVTASLDYQAGADEHVSTISLLLKNGDDVLNDDGVQLTSNSDGLVWQDNADGSWSAVTAGKVSSFTVTPDYDDATQTYTGSYSVEIDGTLDGGVASAIPADNTITIHYQVTDSDGDSTTTSINDAPAFSITFNADGNIDASGAGAGVAISGSTENDTIIGSQYDDVINAGAGDDTVSGGDGNDLISGADGNDNLSGEAGDDMLFGGSGDDTLDGGDGNDQLVGGADDQAAGGVGDVLDGGSGDDTLFAGDETGGDGVDNLSGGDGADTFVDSALDVLADMGASDQQLDDLVPPPEPQL